MKKKIFGVSTTVAGIAAAWMGYNTFVKKHQVDPQPVTAWAYWQGVPLSEKIMPLIETGITGKLKLRVVQ